MSKFRTFLQAWFCVALAAAAAGEAQSVDPLVWSPPGEIPFFVPRVADDAFERLWPNAWARAEQLSAERAAMPAFGLRVRYVKFDGQADKAGIVPQTILIGLDGKPFRTSADFAALRNGQPQELAFVIPDGGQKTTVLQPGPIGVSVAEFDRSNPLHLDADLADPRWADAVRVASLLSDEDPDIAETLLSRAVSAGLPQNPRLAYAAARLALRAGRFEQALAITQRELARDPADPLDFRSLLFEAAVLDYKLDAALECARAGDDESQRQQIPELQRLSDQHKRLPDAIRLAPVPSAQAAALFPEDLMLRAEMLEPASHETAEHAHDATPFQVVRQGHLNELCALHPWPFQVAGARYDNFYFMPAARRAHFGCDFTLTASDTLHTPYERRLILAFFTAQSDDEKTVDAQTSNGRFYGVKFMADREPHLGLLHPLRLFQRDVELPHFFDDPEKVHRVDLYALDGRLEIRVDERRVLYAPLDAPGATMGMKIWYEGVKGELRNVTFCDSLTEDERKTRVDPEVGKPYRFGWTRLHRLVQWAPAETILELLNHGADPNQADDAGATSLHLAVASNRLEIVTLLIGHGAKPEKTDKKGRNAYQLAAELRLQAIAAHLLKTNALLGQGVKPPRPPDDAF